MSDEIVKTQQNQYGSKKLSLPEPEFYVIYAGNNKSVKEWYSLSDEYFNGRNKFIDAKIKVLKGEGDGDIISQYVGFTKVYNDQVKRYGRTRQAVLETIKICKDKDLLGKYLESREMEVVDIMMTLFKQEYATERFGAEKFAEGMEKGIEKGMEKGMEAERHALADRMRGRGMSDNEIIDLLGITPEELNKIICAENVHEDADGIVYK